MSLPLVVIVGPTASGKTSLAIDIASKFNGEIICADSRTVYRHMDVGTAKPSLEERKKVPHWGLDIVDPGQKYSASDFKKYANQKIAEIRSRGKVPFLVGGSGLYIDAVVLDYQFGNKPDILERNKLEALSLDELHQICVERRIDLPENRKNKRYVIRCIENNGMLPKRNITVLDNCIVVGISTDKEELMSRISERASNLLSDGLLREANLLAEMFGWENESMKANVYPIARMFLNHEINQDEFTQLFITADWKLAKRQITWFKRDKYINWFSLEDAKKYLCSELARVDVT